MPGDHGLTRASVVVGRDAELELLRAAVDQAQAGRPTCVFLVGEGGIGKTRLATETAAIAVQGGVAVLSGRAPIATPAPFSVITDALRSWLRTHPVDDAMASFDRGLGLVLPEWPAAATPAELEPGQRRLLALEGVVQLVRAVIAEAGGAVLVADDLHGADAESLETIRYLATARVDGLAIVGALRPSESRDADELVRLLTSEGVAEVVDVRPLAERAVGDLVEALLDANPPSPLVADILARTDGVPLLVEELVRGHVNAGTVRIETDGARWHGGAATVPGTIRDLVNARLATLDPSQRHVVVAGAVVGDFEPVVMRAVADADDAQVADALAAGVRAGLLETTGGAIAFRHAIIREAVLDAAVPHLLDTMHRRAADAVSDETAAGAEAFERRARHLAAVGDHDAAATALTSAADRSLHDHALLAAERAASAALAAARAPATRAGGGRRAGAGAGVAGSLVRRPGARRGDRGRARRHARAPVAPRHLRPRCGPARSGRRVHRPRRRAR